MNGKWKGVGSFDAVTVTTSETTVLEQTLPGLAVAGFDIANTGAALTDFQVYVQYHQLGSWREIELTDVDFIISATSGMTTLGSGSTARLMMNVAGLFAVRLTAKTGTSTSVTALGQVGGAGGSPGSASAAKQDTANTALAAIQAAVESGGSNPPTIVGTGRTTAVAGAVAITLHASTTCSLFRFWLDAGSSSVRVAPDGTVADATDTKFDDSFGPETIRIATPATAITVFFDGAVGTLNWVAGN
ncbi:MAG: hypothetical protein PHU85_15145 [Phycisphaerae bacterium]|nr:hypothetical protein [Phycisphaerae bacterium]